MKKSALELALLWIAFASAMSVEFGVVLTLVIPARSMGLYLGLISVAYGAAIVTAATWALRKGEVND